MVVVRDVGALRKDARRVLEQYLERPAQDVVVVLVAASGAKEDRPLMERTTAVEFERLSGARVPKWITYYATHDLGCEITPEAADLLQNAVGTELAQLKVELDKLASFAMGGDRRVIDEEAVAAVVGVRRGETLGDLLDAVSQRNAPRAHSRRLAQARCGLRPLLGGDAADRPHVACGSRAAREPTALPARRLCRS